VGLCREAAEAAQARAARVEATAAEELATQSRLLEETSAKYKKYKACYSTLYAVYTAPGVRRGAGAPPAVPPAALPLEPPAAPPGAPLWNDTVESPWVVQSTPPRLPEEAAAEPAEGLVEGAAEVSPAARLSAPSLPGAAAADVAVVEAEAEARDSDLTQCCRLHGPQRCSCAPGGALWLPAAPAAAPAPPAPSARLAAPSPPPARRLEEAAEGGPPAMRGAKAWRRRHALTGVVFAVDEPAPAAAPPAAKRGRPLEDVREADADLRYLFTPPPADGCARPSERAPAAAPTSGRRRGLSPSAQEELLLASPPAKALTRWHLDSRPAARAAPPARPVPRTDAPVPPGGKYVEVERRRDVRAAMPAHACIECEKFYKAMGQAPPPCSHSVDARAGHLGQAGRHRARWAPQATPPGFWALGFESNQ